MSFVSLAHAGATERPDGLTDLTVPTGTITSSTSGTWVKPVQNAFDNGTAHDNNDRTIVKNTDAEWVYTFDEATKVNAYTLTSPGIGSYNYNTRMPKNWTFEGSVDYDPTAKTGSWTILDTQSSETGWGAVEQRYYEFENNFAYTSYRFHSTAQNGDDEGYTQFDELEFLCHDTYEPTVNTENFANHVTFTISGYTGATTIAGLPVLVKLSTSSPSGFDYSTCPRDSIRFATMEGVIIPHEIEKWDGNGESLIWVRIPAITGDNTKFQMCFGLNGASEASLPASKVWTKYVGVWHMTEDSGEVADSSGNGLTATPTKGSSGDLTQMVAIEGVVGNARINATTDQSKGNYLSIPNYNSLGVGSSFVMSGWIKGTALNGYPRIFSRKESYNAANGWEIENSNSKNTTWSARGGSETSVTVTTPDYVGNWVHIALVFNATTLTTYANGAAAGTGTIAAAADNGKPLSIGNNSNGSERSFYGAFDECRLMRGAASADYVKAEYDAMRPGFLTVGNIEVYDASAPQFTNVTTTRNADGSFTVSATLASGEVYGSAKVVFADGVETTLAADGDTYSATTSEGLLVDGTTYLPSIRATSPAGTAVSFSCGCIYNGALSIVATSNALEDGLVAGVFTVSRADTNGDLPVTYSVNESSTAEAGTVYQALSGSLLIPDGATSATIEVTPFLCSAVKEDTSVVVDLNAGLYGISAVSGSATMTIVNLTVPEGYNTWVAQENGKASIASNWSEGRVPVSTDKVRFDGRISNASCEWDAGVNDLASTIASWTQTEGYSGTVTIDTVYEGKGDFTCLTVTGDMFVDSGKITHPQSYTISDLHDNSWNWQGDMLANETYRLRIACGSLVVGSGAMIDAIGKGHYISHDGSRMTSTAHGGETIVGGQKAYGNPKEPIHIGMAHRPAGNYYNGLGGGAIYITADTTITVNGTVRADSGNTSNASGAAGSVYLQAQTVAGTGTITARGSSSGDGNYKGTGGRVAIVTQTPVDRSAFSSIAADGEWKNAQNNRASSAGGAGTVYFKDGLHPNGILVVAGKSDSGMIPMSRRFTSVTADGDWTFDSIEFGVGGRLAIPVGTALHVANGFSAITSTSTSAQYCGLIYEGGTLDIGSAETQVMSGKWTLCGWSNLVMNSNLKLQQGAAIGIPGVDMLLEEGASLPTFISSSIEVRGDLTVDSDAAIRATTGGFYKSSNSTTKGVLGYQSHGGRTLHYGTGVLHYKSFDSVFAPCLPGVSVPEPNGQGKSQSGGAVRLIVKGDLVLNGPATANGSPDSYNQGGNCAGGNGGSIDITAGTISGSGNISADGGSYAWQRGVGGRVAVKLTKDGADFSRYTGRMSASGRSRPGSDQSLDGSCGTVFTQTAADRAKHDKCGTVTIAFTASDSLRDNTNTTEMVSLGYGGDQVSDYKKVSYVVSQYGRAAVNTNVQVKAVTLADRTAYLDLEGNELKVGRFTYAVQGEEGTELHKLGVGVYSYAKLVELGVDRIIDSSQEQTGSITITGASGMQLYIR